MVTQNVSHESNVPARHLAPTNDVGFTFAYIFERTLVFQSESGRHDTQVENFTIWLIILDGYDLSQMRESGIKFRMEVTTVHPVRVNFMGLVDKYG